MATPSRQICARMMVHLAVLPAINNRQRALSVRDILARSPSVAMVGQARSHGSVPGGRTVSNNCTACQPETPHEPCQRQITAQDLRQDAPTDGLSMNRSQTCHCTSVSSTTVSLQLTPDQRRRLPHRPAAGHLAARPGQRNPAVVHRRRQGDEPGGQPTSNPHAAASFNPMQRM
jgi:hypothetical protein